MHVLPLETKLTGKFAADLSVSLQIFLIRYISWQGYDETIYSGGANLATNLQDLVAKVKNLVALAPVLGTISRP